MARSKAKQAELDIRDQTYRVSDAQICMTCKHWWNYMSGGMNGSCQPKHLAYRDKCDHFKPTPANGCCGLWTAKEDGK